MARKKKPDQSKEFAKFVQERTTRPGEEFQISDVFTGVEARARARNHYEYNSGIPFAPPIDQPRLTLRERVERLQGAGVDLNRYLPDESDDNDFTDPEDAEPLTSAESAYVALNDHLDFLASKPADVPEASPGGAAPPPAPPPPAQAAAPEPPQSGGAGGTPPAKGGS